MVVVVEEDMEERNESRGARCLWRISLHYQVHWSTTARDRWVGPGLGRWQQSDDGGMGCRGRLVVGAFRLVLGKQVSPRVLP